jgi:hypothetical protein
LTDKVVLEAGANESITQVDTTLVNSATTGAGGDNGDWVITGDVTVLAVKLAEIVERHR